MLVVLSNAVKVESVPLNLKEFQTTCKPVGIRTYDRSVGDLASIGYNGQPARNPFRVVRPPITVLIDLTVLFPREPHRSGRFHAQRPAAAQGRRGAAELLGHLRAGRLVGPGDLPDRLRVQAQNRHALGAGLDAASQRCGREARPLRRGAIDPASQRCGREARPLRRGAMRPCVATMRARSAPAEARSGVDVTCRSPVNAKMQP